MDATTLKINQKTKMNKFLKWYNYEDNHMYPVPSNKQLFWFIIIMMTCFVMKIVQMTKL